jgi:glutamate-1-semialdehyde 2,1-aminomutase
MSNSDQLLEAYRQSHPNSARWHERAKAFFPADGATHFTRVRAPFRPYITHARGSRKWDVDGYEYIDYVLGHGALILGHAHPAVVEAVQQQAAKGFHFGDNHPLEVQWAELIRRLMPAAERIEFFASGQEANLMAIRLSRVATGKRRILKFRHNYHGWADELCAEGTPGANEDQVTVIDVGDPEQVDRHLATGQFAAVLIEGGGGRIAGRVPTPVEFFQALPAITRKHGVIFILDEVVTGFREAAGGWQSIVGIEPDITTIGKAVSGGLPSGALLGRADLLASLSPTSPPARLVMHGGTWNAVPLTAAAGIAACELYLDGAPQQAACTMAGRLRHQANDRFRRAGAPARLYGTHTVAHIYIGPIERESADDSAPPTTDPAKLANPRMTPVYKRLDLHLLQRGVSSLRGEGLMLSSAHTEEDIDRTVAALADALQEMERERMLSL